VAEITLAGLHKGGSFNHLCSDIMPWMSNDIVCKKSRRNEGSDELHIEPGFQTRELKNWVLTENEGDEED
jgi:hypothetical protein